MFPLPSLCTEPILGEGGFLAFQQGVGVVLVPLVGSLPFVGMERGDKQVWGEEGEVGG